MIRILCIPPTIINGLFDFITVIESLYPYDKGGIGIVANECVREMKTPETQSMDIMHVNRQRFRGYPPWMFYEGCHMSPSHFTYLIL
jgi:hypothetical protein